MRGTIKDLDASVDQPSKSREIVNAYADDMERIATAIQAELIPLKNTYGTGIRVYAKLPVFCLISVRTQ